MPLFATQALDWGVPDPALFDALILTSANAVRCGGDGLKALLALPVLAVGNATAAAARSAGFDVMTTGSKDAEALLADAHAAGIGQALHLGGRESMVKPEVGAGRIVRQSIAVYASDPLPVSPQALASLVNGIGLLHSPRAAHRLVELVDVAGFAREHITLVALSAAVAAAAGGGWQVIKVPPLPTDDALVQCVFDVARSAD